MGEVDAFGEAVTGGLLSRAVEPRAGEGDGHTHEGKCLNCGAELEGPFCHDCGQHAHVHRTLGAFWHDLLHGVFHFEGKIWRTLPLLAWRPGELTRRYITGERARFVSPVALFLFTVFLMFAVYSVAGPDLGASDFHNTRGEVEASLNAERRNLRELIETRAEIRRKGDPEAVEDHEQEIRQAQEGVQALERFLAVGAGDTSEVIGGKTGWKTLDDGLKKVNANPQLALYKIQSNAYKFSWALIPISVPFVWLLFLHRRRYREYGAYDHTVFVTYSITFMSMTLVALAVLQLIPGTSWLRTALIFVPPVHIYLQLRGAYQIGRLSAAWRTALLLIFANLAIALFLLLLVAIGVLG